LNSYGVNADIVIARSRLPMDEKRREKIAISCSIPKEQVISAPNVSCIYSIPTNFEKDKLSDTISHLLGLRSHKTDLKEWNKFINGAKRSSVSDVELNIAIVGKYFDTGDGTLSDSYISVIEAAKISAFANGVKPNLVWINSKEFEKDPAKIKELKKFDGIIVPGGFGSSGIEGIIKAIQFARENKIPYFGLCYGMQLMVIEHARNVLGWKGAHTAEIDPCASKLIIDVMPEQKKKIADKNMGGSMRLGAYEAKLKAGTVAAAAYGKRNIVERHRHRYEVNPEYIPQIEASGLVFSGTSPDERLMEIAELPKEKHPFFLGTQFHPEFLARPLSPHPLFSAFIEAAIKNKKK
ncbi:MAG TPA: CTP synthase, partial [Candidatus Paceibacterota bacterium]|nr:CTP synthase [Candidatus Paceibacterota bacterium]